MYQAYQDTSLEYPHEVVWNILKINLFYTAAEKSLAVKFLKRFGNLTHPRVIGTFLFFSQKLVPRVPQAEKKVDFQDDPNYLMWVL